MRDPSFAHLHCYSQYSFMNGSASIKSLVTQAKHLGMNALALTDRGNLHGALEFYRCCRNVGIKPIIGLEADMTFESCFDHDERSGGVCHSLTLLCRDKTGFHNLLKLASESKHTGHNSNLRINKDLLLHHHQGIICLSGGVSSELNQAILQQDPNDPDWTHAMQVATWFHNLYGDRYFIELMNHDSGIKNRCVKGAVAVAKLLGLPLVATHNCCYAEPADERTHNVLLSIRSGTGVDCIDPFKSRTRGDRMLHPQEMYERFVGLEEAVSRSQEIADSVDLDLQLGRRHFSVPGLPTGVSSQAVLRERCVKGLEQRYAGNQTMMSGGNLSDEIRGRLDRELEVICQLGFADYILVVCDFVQHGRELGIQVTARGNFVGSLVCYSLHLSYVCPVQYGLLSEKFLSELHLHSLVIRLDVCMERRAELINLVKDKYGAANFARIGTFEPFMARYTIGQVGKALGMTAEESDRVVSLIPEVLGITLKTALLESEELQAASEQNPAIRELLDNAAKIEGLTREFQPHGVSFVIGNKPLTECVPLTKMDRDGDFVTQWSMADVELTGLCQFDLLGLKHLTLVGTTIDLIEQSSGIRLNPFEFDLDDTGTYLLLQSGETEGVNQCSSDGFRELLIQVRPDCFRDLLASLALYRPGWTKDEMVPQYLDFKRGHKTLTHVHPMIEKTLSETYGVLLFQEQAMQILSQFAGIQLSDAFRCLKGIAKCEVEVISENQSKFMAGANKLGLTPKDAQNVWDTILRFARIGLSKSHATSSAASMFQTAYLKAHFPVEFKTALERGKAI